MRGLVARWHGVAILWLVVVLISSCKTEKEVVRGPLPNRSLNQIWEAQDSQKDFKTLKAKVHVNLVQNGEKQSFNCKVRIVQDSAIWVSITPLLGIEVFRMIITTDSVKLLDRLNKKYFADSLALLETMTKVPVTFDMLQSLMTGTLVELYPQERYRLTRAWGNYQIGLKKKGQLRREFRRTKQETPITHEMTIDRDPRQLLNTFLKDMSTGNLVRAFYSEHEMVDSISFPMEMKLVTAGSGRVKVDLEWSRVKMKEPLKISFKIPSKYQPYENK